MRYSKSTAFAGWILGAKQKWIAFRGWIGDSPSSIFPDTIAAGINTVFSVSSRIPVNNIEVLTNRNNNISIVTGIYRDDKE